nr:zinc finger, CCHC-type [Tanacetum cinerariifolium]
MKTIEKLGLRHKEHIASYGKGNERRLTGHHETVDINTFKLVDWNGVGAYLYKKGLHSIVEVQFILDNRAEDGGDNPTVEQVRERAKWDNNDYVCRGLIFIGMSESLFDIYQNVETSRELWDTLEAKYMAEDASSKKFLVSNFSNYKMIDSIPVLEQYNELFGILGRFTQHKMNMDESIQDNDKRKGNNVAGPSVVNKVEHNNSSKYNENKGKRKHHDIKADPNKKPKVTCWKCGKPGHLKKDCKAGNVGNKANRSYTKGLVDGLSNFLKGRNMFNKSFQVYYVTYVFEAYFVQDDDVAWCVNSGAIVHVCKDRCWFKTYKSLNDGSILYMGNESTALVHGCGCVYLRFSSRKVVSLLNVLHVSNIRKNLVSSSVLNSCHFKQVIESNKLVLSKHAFISKSKLNDSILWHARLGHVHFKRMQDMSKDGLILAFDMDTEKCERIPRKGQNQIKTGQKQEAWQSREKSEAVTLEEKQIEEERAAKAKYWKLPVCYDDDDDEERSDSLDDNIIFGLPSFSAIIPNEPVLSNEEPDNSLSIGDEHLDTIPATESDEFINSSVENLIPIPGEFEGIPEHVCDVPSHDNYPPLDVSKDQFEDFSKSNKEFSLIDDDSFSIDDIDYVEALLPDSELVSSEVMEIVILEVGGIDDDILLTIKDDILRENLLNVNHLFAKIKTSNDNPIRLRFKIKWTLMWAYDGNNWRLCDVFLDGTSLKGVTEWYSEPSAGRPAAASRRGGTGGRAGNGGGRTRGRFDDQGDGRIDSQGDVEGKDTTGLEGLNLKKDSP